MTLASLELLLVCSLALPFFGALFAFGSKRDVLGNTFAQSFAIFGGLSGLAAIVGFFMLGAAGQSGPVVLFESATLSLTLSTLSSFFLGIVYLGVVLVSLYNIGSLPLYKDTYSLRFLALTSAFFIFGMEATLLSGNIFTFLLSWEVMSVAAYFLVIADRKEESLRAGFLYFIMTHIGYAALMAGFFILASGNAFMSWSSVAANASTISPVLSSIAFVLLFIGFGGKAGLVPLHQWLPYAHPQAPSGSSALLSGVMLKVALYGFILVLGLITALPLFAPVLVIIVGLLSAFFGALHAAVEHDAKKLLAWSSIDNMGLIFTSVGILMLLPALPASEAVYVLGAGIMMFLSLHVINHFLFKLGLFMATGAIVARVHTRELDDLGGMAQRLPLFSGVFLILALGAAALPPLGTFFGEWAFIQSLALGTATLPLSYAVASGIALACVALVGGLSIFAFVKMFSAIFLGRARTEVVEHVGKVSLFETIPPLLCALLLGLSGLVLFPLFSQSAFPITFDSLTAPVSIGGTSGISAWFVGLLLAVLFVCTTAVLKLLVPVIRIRSTETWDCGQPLTPRMQYTATGFAAPIRFFFRAFVLSKKTLIGIPVVATNPWITKKELVWSTDSFFEIKLYRPIARLIVFLSSLVKLTQTGVIQVYLLFLVLALIGVMIFAL